MEDILLYVTGLGLVGFAILTAWIAVTPSMFLTLT